MMKVSFNMIVRTGNPWTYLWVCSSKGHKWEHSGAEKHYDSSETHYFACTACHRIERDLSDNWKSQRTPEAQKKYLQR
jgi:hypothetical protein